MLRDEIAKYTELSGNDGEHTPIGIIGAYLDGYEKGLESRENKGEWISAKVGKLFPSNDYKCSICGNILNFDGVNCGRGDANFCPNCGADMRGET